MKIRVRGRRVMSGEGERMLCLPRGMLAELVR